MDRFGSIEGSAAEERAAGADPHQIRLRRIAELIGCDIDDLTDPGIDSSHPIAQAGELLRLWQSLSGPKDRETVLNLARSLSHN